MDIDYGQIRSAIIGGSIRPLGYGAGRRVYDMGNGYVVKVARNSFGIRQNRNEYRLNLKYDGNLLAKIVSVSDGYRMLVMQAATPLDQIRPVLDYFHVNSREELRYVPELVDLTRRHHLAMREFLASRNWGLIGNTPVIIDYGLIKRRGW